MVVRPTITIHNQRRNAFARPQPKGCGMLGNIPQPFGCGREQQKSPKRSPSVSGLEDSGAAFNLCG
jgi:hypothetical protein